MRSVFTRLYPFVAIALVVAIVPGALASSSPPSPPSGPNCTGQHCVRVLTIHYSAHDGARRAAYVIVPRWYRPETDPPLPLVISPHGRGVTALANVRRWGRLPAFGGFAVVNPEGQGRRLRLFSWGYPGQIADLARMPAIVTRALPWLHLDLAHVYAFGASMGGQETLLLVARHPTLLAGAAAFDSVADMARRYWDFPRIRCVRWCLRGRPRLTGVGLQSLARTEIGGTPASARRAYAERSPLTYALRIAESGVPLQLWWSSADNVVVNQEAQSVRLLKELRRLGARGPVSAFTGTWPHAAEMSSKYALRRALEGFGLIAARGVGDPEGAEPPPEPPRPAPPPDGTR